MKSTDMLKEDHKAIKRMLRILDVLAQKLDSGEDIDVSMLERGVDFVRTFADKSHHGMEEGALFPLMESKGFTRESGPLGQMLVEHDEGRRFVRGLSDGIIRYRAGDRGAVGSIVDNVKGYTNLLRRHIDKEDFILFSMADRLLTPEEDEKLYQAFTEVDAKEMGWKRQEYMKVLSQFEDHLCLEPSGDAEENSRPGCFAFVEDINSALDEATQTATSTQRHQ